MSGNGIMNIYNTKAQAWKAIGNNISSSTKGSIKLNSCFVQSKDTSADKLANAQAKAMGVANLCQLATAGASIAKAGTDIYTALNKSNSSNKTSGTDNSKQSYDTAMQSLQNAQTSYDPETLQQAIDSGKQQASSSEDQYKAADAALTQANTTQTNAQKKSEGCTAEITKIKDDLTSSLSAASGEKDAEIAKLNPNDTNYASNKAVIEKKYQQKIAGLKTNAETDIKKQEQDKKDYDNIATAQDAKIESAKAAKSTADTQKSTIKSMLQSLTSRLKNVKSCNGKAQ